MPALLPVRASKDAKKTDPHKRRHAAHQHKRHKKKHKKKRHHHHPHGQPPSVPPRPTPNPSGGSLPPPPDLDHRKAERLLWRAGFGPRPGDVDAVVAKGLDATVHSLVYPGGTVKLNGPDPTDDDGNALAPADAWGHDHCWWLDRMVRSDQQLVERMTLIWHDWFATSNDKVSDQQLMLDQNATLRANALGSFHDLLRAVTVDPAMLVWLDGIDNTRWDPNENYAREVMELFTLGADRGAYTEQDVREQARAFTRWRATWTDGVGLTDFRYDPNRHDGTNKTVFGQTGNFDWQDALRLCLENSYHASFFVTKLWSYFVPTPPDSSTQAALQKIYLDSNYGIAPVVEAILKHPDFYADRALVKPPVVYNAGLLRVVGRGVDTTAWAWLGSQAGQQLFYPPNVSGWDDSMWLDTSTWRGRSDMVTYAMRDRAIDPWDDKTVYSTTETPAEGVTKALDFLGKPAMTDETRKALLNFSSSCLPSPMEDWQQKPYRAMRQNALRHLILTSSDWHAS
ncbi:MAG: DUF1800 domain-containing protein [Actinobacteria bacterium]|nr:MAG: DUF1800 domain-containing protein [Actinomycetota bacterium]